MIYETIYLKDYFKMLENNPILTTYCPSNFVEWSTNDKRKAVLIIPGGAYVNVSDREGEPVALRFMGKNIAAFVLNYTTYPKLKYPNPFVEVFAALAYLRHNAHKYHIDIDKIAVLGFSAGGHLAAFSSAFCEKEEYADYLGIKLADMKINGCLLGYPVISTTFGHEVSIQNITQGRKDLMEIMSIDKQITPNYPKTFIWHTTFDSVVPVKNALALALALEENKVFFEMHIYPKGDHGQATCDTSSYNETNSTNTYLTEIAYNSNWLDQAIHFIKEYL